MVAGGILLLTFSKQQLFQFINTHNTPLYDTIMYQVTIMGQGEVIIPILMLPLAIPAYRNWWYFTTAFMCNVIPLVIQRSMKYWFDSPRPLAIFNHADWIHVLPDWPVFLHRSFPSGHSEGAFSFFCFLSLLLPPRLRGFGFLFFLLALGVCYSRVYLAAHFFSDIYVGSLIGTVLTTIIFIIMHSFKYRFVKKIDTVA